MTGRQMSKSFGKVNQPASLNLAYLQCRYFFKINVKTDHDIDSSVEISVRFHPLSFTTILYFSDNLQYSYL